MTAKCAIHQNVQHVGASEVVDICITATPEKIASEGNDPIRVQARRSERYCEYDLPFLALQLPHHWPLALQ